MEKKYYLAGKECKRCRHKKLYSTHLYCAARKRYLYLEDTIYKYCKYYKEVE